MSKRSCAAPLLIAALLPLHAQSDPDGAGGNANPAVVSPEQFGAKGDGSTDDSAAIQAAIDALPATGGKVLFAARTYGVGTTLSITRNWVTLEGVNAGVASTVFDHTPTSGSVLKVLGAFDLLSMHPNGKRAAQPPQRHHNSEPRLLRAAKDRWPHRHQARQRLQAA